MPKKPFKTSIQKSYQAKSADIAKDKFNSRLTLLEQSYLEMVNEIQFDEDLLRSASIEESYQDMIRDIKEDAIKEEIELENVRRDALIQLILETKREEKAAEKIQLAYASYVKRCQNREQNKISVAKINCSDYRNKPDFTKNSTSSSIKAQ